MKKIIILLITLLIILPANVSCQHVDKNIQGADPPDTAVKGELVLAEGNFRVNRVARRWGTDALREVLWQQHGHRKVGGSFGFFKHHHSGRQDRRRVYR